MQLQLVEYTQKMMFENILIQILVEEIVLSDLEVEGVDDDLTK
jgi:hypothetical protein